MPLARDDGLGDISRLALLQLTNLLSMDTSNDIAKPSMAWLDEQEVKVAQLHWSLQAPIRPLERLALRMNRNRKLPFFPQVAQLCPSHSGLDPRVIRNMCLLVGNECTIRTDRYRSYRGRIAFPNDVAVWLDRIDSVTAMWIGKDAFKMVFGYKSAMPGVKSVKSGCEACILAVVGARPQMLSDLRANMLVRKLKNGENTQIPRLLRIVDAWIGHFDDEYRLAINDCSETLAMGIYDVYKEMKRRKEKRRKGRKNTVKPKRKRRGNLRPPRSRDNGLPSPTQPPEGRYSRRMSIPNYDDDGSCNIAEDVPLVMKHESQLEDDDDDDDGNGFETWTWLDGKMEGQGLTLEEREQVLGSVHPSFTEYRAPSARPESLVSQRPEETMEGNMEEEEEEEEKMEHKEKKSEQKEKKVDKKKEKAKVETIHELDEGKVQRNNKEKHTEERKLEGIDELDEGSWVSCTVHTFGDRHQVEEVPLVPPIPGLYRQGGTLQDNVPFSRRYLVNPEDTPVSEYIPARKEWASFTPSKNPFSGRRSTAPTTTTFATAPTHRPPPPPPASSFYSDHPGFPRNHRTTVVVKPPRKSVSLIREEGDDHSDALTTWPSVAGISKHRSGPGRL